MKPVKTTLIFLMLINQIHAFEDSDLDGIENKYDLCPNTPFDAKVDRFGCTAARKTEQTSHNHLSLRIGTTLRQDDRYDDDTSLNFYAGYQFSNWDIGISNTRSVTHNYEEEYTDNDLYLSLGYTIYMPKTMFHLTLGSKITSDSSDNDRSGSRGKYINTGQEADQKRDNDYFAALNTTYMVTGKQDIFFYYSFTNSGDSPSYDYEDYSSFSIGSGYQFTSSYYSALSYNYTGSIYQDGEAQENISWYNSYKLNKNFFVAATYSYALDDYSYENSLTLTLGTRF